MEKRGKVHSTFQKPESRLRQQQQLAAASELSLKVERGDRD